MKQVLAILALAAFVAGCATDNDGDSRGSSGTVILEDSGYDAGAPSRNPNLETLPAEPLPHEQRVPDDEERDNGLEPEREVIP